MGLGAVGEQVDRVAGQVAALDERPGGPEGEHRFGGPRHARLVVDLHARQLGDLVEVRGGHGGDRHQAVAYGVEGGLGEQGVPVLGDAHGVDDGGGLGRREEFGDGRDEGSGGEHPGLDRLDPDVVDDAAVLGADRFVGELPDALDTE